MAFFSNLRLFQTYFYQICEAKGTCYYDIYIQVIYEVFTCFFSREIYLFISNPCGAYWFFYTFGFYRIASLIQRHLTPRLPFIWILILSLWGITLASHLLYAEAPGIPLINNHHPADYRADSQNWSVVEDHRGYIYIANISGVLEYDGVAWRLITLPGNAFATALAIDEQGVIFVGSNSEFGYLKPDAQGRLVYVSLIDRFPEDLRDFSFIWRILATSQGIYFYNYDHLFYYRDGQIRHWKFSRLSKVFEVENRIYVYDYSSNGGLYIFDHPDEIDFSAPGYLPACYIHSVLPFNETQLLAYSLNKGLLLIDIPTSPEQTDLNPTPLEHQEVSHYLAQHSIMNAIRLHNGNYAFGTHNAGFVIMNPEGKVINLVSKNQGLQNETANYLFQDSRHLLWIALDYGISAVNIQFPLTHWNQHRGIEGIVLDTHRFEDEIYVATWQGLFKMNPHIDPQKILLSQAHTYPPFFEAVKAVKGICWQIQPIVNHRQETEFMMVASSQGLLVFDRKGQMQNLEKGDFLYAIQSSQNPEIILAGAISGLYLIRYLPEEKKFISEGIIEAFEDYEIIRIDENQQLQFYISHRYQGISSIQFIPQKHSTTKQSLRQKYHIESRHFQSEAGLPLRNPAISFQTASGSLMLTDNGIYRPTSDPDSPNQPKFKAINPIINCLIQQRVSIKAIFTDPQQNLWVHYYLRHNRSKRLLRIDYHPSDQSYRISQAIPVYSLETSINNIFFEPERSLIWIAADDGVYRYHTAQQPMPGSQTHCYIRNIKINNQLFFGGHAQQSSQEPNQNLLQGAFKASHNNLIFQFASTDFFSPTTVLYSSQLEGVEKSWTAWTYSSQREFSNLPPGHYTFWVRATDSFGFVTQADSFRFRIFPPWYKSMGAYLFYAVTFALTVFLIVRISNKRLIRTKYRLEQTINERTAEIARQQIALQGEKEKSDKLLRNILPVQIADELKTNGQVKAQYYDMVSVMFMDFKDFSKISQYINPLHLISELDKSFGYFDEVCKRHGLEKIKTMGDAYMCAGGIPKANKSNPFDAILAALEIIRFVREAEKDQWLCELRLGIHTGEIVAGVIGKNKFTYDIWGETVNTASRMESSGEPGKINISGETHELVKDFFDCVHRGILPAKHRDEYDMYFVQRIKKKYSADENGFSPNDLFRKELELFTSKLIF